MTVEQILWSAAFGGVSLIGGGAVSVISYFLSSIHKRFEGHVAAVAALGDRVTRVEAGHDSYAEALRGLKADMDQLRADVRADIRSLGDKIDRLSDRA